MILDIVPNHMATDDANRYWTEQRVEVLRRRRGDREVPPLLRHRPPRRRAPGGPGGVRGDPPAGARARPRRCRRRAADRPPGRAGRPAGLPRAAARRRRRARVGGEDPRPGRDAAAVVAGGGDGRLRVPQRRGGPVRRPRRRGPSDRPVARALRRRRGRSREYAAEAKLEQASTTFTAEVDRLRAQPRPATTCPRRSPRCPSTAPTSATARPRRRTARCSREAGIEWLLDAPPEFVTRFQQTTPPVMAKGVEDTAFYRYLRLLALNDVGGDPGRFGLPIEDFHAANAERAAAQPARHPDPRHQALGRRAGADRRAGRHGRGSGRRTCAAGSS